MQPDHGIDNSPKSLDLSACTTLKNLTFMLPALFKHAAYIHEGGTYGSFVLEPWTFATRALLSLQHPVVLECLDINLHFANDSIHIDSLLPTEQRQGRPKRNLKKIPPDEVRRGLLDHVRLLESLTRLDDAVAGMVRAGLIRRVRVSGLDMPGPHFYKMMKRGKTSSRDLLLAHFPAVSSTGILEILEP